MKTMNFSRRYQLLGWLGLSHLAAALVAGRFVQLAPAGWPPLRTLLVALLLGGAAGLLVSLPVRSALELAAAALAQLSRGQAIAGLPAGWQRRWGPLADLLALVDALGARERELGHLRDDLVRSTGQAAAQAERNRLARELHDSIKQQLYAINVSAAAALARWDADLAGARAAVEDVRRAAQGALAEMAALLQQLRPAPLAAAGLLDALAEQCEALAHRTGAQVTVDLGTAEDAAAYAAAVDERRLAPGAEEAIFRIGQEALNNIARHARARQVVVRVRVEGGALRLEIGDDGQGFVVAETGRGTYGLAGMRDRAAALGAALELDSAPGSGTRLVLTVPLVAAAEERSRMDAQITGLLRKVETWHWAALAAALWALTVAQRLMLFWFAGERISVASLSNLALLLVLAAGATMAWVQVRRATLGVSLLVGADHPTMWRLRRDAHNRTMWMALAAVIILPAAWMPAGYPSRLMIALVVGLACALLAAAQIALTHRATEGYWQRLSAAELASELEQAWSQRYLPLLVLGVALLGYVWLQIGGPTSLVMWRPSREGLIDILATLYLLLLMGWAVVTHLQVRAWRKRQGAAGSQSSAGA